MATKRELQRLAFRTVEAWARWLPLHHASSPGLWVKFAKKGSKAESITYAQALDVALAWGWIDGQKAALDESWCRNSVDAAFVASGRRSIGAKRSR